MNRNLDGMYFRVKRDEKWRNVCISDMSDAELEEVVFKRADTRFLQGIIINLVHVIKEIGEQFNIVAGISEEDE